MKHLIFAFSAVTLVCLSAKAEDIQRISVSEWAKQSVTFDTRDLETKTLGTCSDCENKSVLKKARVQFGKGAFDEAIANYNAIPRGNTYWLSAVEEKGWAYFRQENYEKALAQTKTLTAPPFAEIVNSEAFLLQSLTQLKICDYKGVFETHNLFKEKQKARILEVQNLAQSGWNEALANLLKKTDKFPLTLDDMGDAVQHLPLLIFKDLEFQKQALRFKASEAALSMANAKSTSLKNLEQFKSKTFLALKKRVQELAQSENDKNFKVIQKLNLVEVEAIQRIHTDMNLSEDAYKKGKFAEVSNDKLVFIDDGKPWIDELDKFEVTAKSCLKGIRRKM